MSNDKIVGEIMNKILLILIFFTFHFIQAQVTIQYPFPKSNAKWISTQNRWDNLTQTWYEWFYIDSLAGDTLIENFLWQKVNRCIIEQVDNLTFNKVPTYLYAFIKSDSGKVWVRRNEYIAGSGAAFSSPFGVDTTTTLIYDFNLVQADSFNFINHLYLPPYSNIVDSITTFTTLIDSRRSINIDHLNGQFSFYQFHEWIEGIGSNIQFLHDESSVGGESNSYLLCFEHNNQLVYELNQFGNNCGAFQNCDLTTSLSLKLKNFKCYYNNESKKLFLKKDEKFKVEIISILGESIIYEDVQNELDLSDLQNGLYIAKINNTTTKFLKY